MRILFESTAINKKNRAETITPINSSMGCASNPARSHTAAMLENTSDEASNHALVEVNNVVIVMFISVAL